MNGKVETVKIASVDYAALAYKDPDVLYFVTNYGDFGPNNLDDIKIYLGTRLIGIDPDVISQSLMTLDGNVVAINAASDITSYHQDISLASFEGATFFELNLHATLQNLGQSAANVEVWMERGHYEKEEKEGVEEIVWYTDEHIAATQVFMAGRANAVCCANIAGHLIGPYSADPCQYVRVCFSSTSPVNICSSTPQNNLTKATTLTLRCWTPVAVG